jgi:uncharacterized protein YecE (DUF72 family)
MPPEHAARIKIGTCAWSFDDWAEVFYPAHLPAGKRLEFYARHFTAVEVDSTFYHLPAPHVAKHWAEVTPPEFCFCPKLSREITHERKLRNCDELLAEFIAGVEPLASKLGCVLVQLPPYFTLREDEHALRDFVLALPCEVRFAIEFRHAEWRLPGTAHLLEEHGVCWVWNDLTPPERATEGPFEYWPRTADFLYLRLMGDLDTKYRDDGRLFHRYRKLLWPRDAALDTWALRIAQTLGEVRSAFVMANNHYEGFSPETAARFAERAGLSLKLPTPEELAGGRREDDRQLKLL